MKPYTWTGTHLRTAGIALALACTGSTAALAQTIDVVRAAQAAQVEKIAQATTPSTPPGAGSPIIRSPDATSGANNSTAKPDNMPVKRPDKPTNDPMSRQPPASGGNAK
jgi:hypothetical protein